MSYLILFCLLSLFTPFKIESGIGQVRPFDGLAAIMLVLMVISPKILNRTRFSAGFFILLPYFFLHVLSALTVDFINGIKEFIQISIISVFTIGLATQMEKVNHKRIGALMIAGLAVIMAFNIGWHIVNGYYVGWKHLADPKATFTFLPMALGCVMAFSKPGWQFRRFLLPWFIIGVLIIFSGERKALISFGILSIMIFAQGRVLAAVPFAAVAIVFGLLVGLTSSNPYISRQINSILDPPDTKTTVADIENGFGADSQSDTQRTFATEQAKIMIKKHPILGVGTNQYVDIVRKHFIYLPHYLVNGIHGEFLRVLTENGVLGLSLYLLVWITAWFRTRRSLAMLYARKLINKRQLMLLPTIFFVPALFYVSFEASGTHSFVLLAVMSLLPDFLRQHWLRAPSTASLVRTAQSTNALPPGASQSPA